MKKYECKNWIMNDIAHAMKGYDEQGRRIVVPFFQRGKRWNDKKREKFIESLLKGYPVGTLLFSENGDKEYAVIDGLQRSTTICEYILYPTLRKNLNDVSNDVLDACRVILFPNNQNFTINQSINEVILSFISSFSNFDCIEVSEIAEKIFDSIPTYNLDFRDTIKKLKDVLKPWYNNYKQDYESIKQTEIPVIIYSGNNEYLNDIFRRINEQGQPLIDYEIYAATWNMAKYTINNPDIIDNVIRKYDSLSLDDYTIDKYDSNELRRSKKLSAFEFLFGFGKTLIKKYDFLNLDSKGKKDDEVTAIGFELFDVCINNSKHISELGDTIAEQKIDLNLFDRRINEAIKFVSVSLSPICTFRGNHRHTQYLHPKYLILALVAFVFREMYDVHDMTVKKLSWTTNAQSVVSRRILSHYVFELVSNDWHDGGIGKMYSSVKERSFMLEYEKKNWESLLDSYFGSELIVRRTSFPNPTNADKILMNCIYTGIFTVRDNCPIAKYDIEHLIPKEILRKLMAQSGNTKGLPGSHIANLCYLPENINRRKKDKTIYEDNSINIAIKDIEKKYSFTSIHDFDFIYLPYDTTDANVLQDEYIKYLTSRFNSQKQKIMAFFGYADN